MKLCHSIMQNNLVMNNSILKISAMKNSIFVLTKVLRAAWVRSGNTEQNGPFPRNTNHWNNQQDTFF